ncbi:MAG TPA: NIPSNAP family protein [Burkholderiales bacterium]|nr:NIPSNAP family protein [Burkholderiales bacterium]
MIHEMRTYQLHPGRAPEFLKHYEKNGLAIITRYAKLAGCWTKESGTLNSVVFLWGYEDFGRRSAQRGKLAQDNDWQAFVPTLLPYLVHQESVFLVPAPFSPL